MMSSPERPPKRTRQACEPCRRKKSRCPGEQPVCSHCARLSQECSYAPIRPDGTAPPLHNGDSHLGTRGSLQSGHSPESQTADRLSILEQGMAQIQSLLRAQSRPRDSPLHDLPAESNIASRTGGSPNQDEAPSWPEIQRAGELYSTFCDSQPLPLFSPEQWIDSLWSRDTEVIHALIALTERFDTTKSVTARTQRYNDFLNSARKRVMKRVAEGPVELSTIQTLCLLGLIAFNGSYTAQASTYISLAMDLAQSAGLATEYAPTRPNLAQEERRRCYWTIVLLRNLFGNMAGVSSFTVTDYTPKPPRSAEQPAGSSSNITEPGLQQQDGGRDYSSDLGILSYVTSMSEIWARTVRHARRRGKSQQPPPWAPDSDYQRILAQLMNFEPQMPYKYRFKPARFSEFENAELQDSRTFWAPWFLLQMQYHSILSLLNHPLILSLQLRSFRMTMVPEVFLQHTDDLLRTHTTWVIHLIDQHNIKNFQSTDPYPAYCVAIMATIFLQQSYSDDEEVRASKKEDFDKCLAFVRQAGLYWPRAAQLADKVEQFQQLVSASSQPNATATNGNRYIDLRLFWDIIESCFASELPMGSENYFGSSLLSYRTLHNAAEVVNGRLLPSPTRIERGHSAANTPVQPLPFGTNVRPAGAIPGVLLPADDQVLAQSYFAQGQDFVNLDDWWYTGQPV
jgi:hypothetical protein